MEFHSAQFVRGYDSMTDGIFSESAADWTGTIGGLPLYRKIADGRYYIYSYTVDEIAVNGETVFDKTVNGGSITGITDDCSVTVNNGSGAAQIVNREAADISLDIVKAEKDNSGRRLEGAVFTLWQIEDTKPALGGTYITKYGTELQTSAATAGYIMLTGTTVYFKVAGGKVIWLIKGAGKPSTWEARTEPEEGEMVSFTTASGSSNAFFTVENEPGAALYLTGFLLIIAAGLGLLMGRRKTA